MRNNPACCFELFVQDMPCAKTFYEGVLGMKLDRLPGPDIDMQAFGTAEEKNTGSGGDLVHMPGVSSGGNSMLVSFACKDCAVADAGVLSRYALLLPIFRRCPAT